MEWCGCCPILGTPRSRDAFAPRHAGPPGRPRASLPGAACRKDRAASARTSRCHVQTRLITRGLLTGTKRSVLKFTTLRRRQPDRSLALRSQPFGMSMHRRQGSVRTPLFARWEPSQLAGCTDRRRRNGLSVLIMIVYRKLKNESGRPTPTSGPSLTTSSISLIISETRAISPASIAVSARF